MILEIIFLMFLLGLLILVIENPFLIVPILVIFVIFLSHRTFSVSRNTAEQVNFWSGVQSKVIFLELIGLSLFAAYTFVHNSSIQLQLLNMTSTSNLKEVVSANPTGSISVLIGIVSIITVYLYLFSILNKAKYFSEISETQDKYISVFWILPVFLFIGGLGVISILGALSKQTTFDVVLFVIGFLNLIITLPIAIKLKKYFYNTNLTESSGLKLGDYDYKFLEHFRKLKAPALEELTSDCILILTFLWAGLALFFNCNIFLLLMMEFCLLVSHFWSSQLKLLPQRKITLELMEKDNLGNPLRITDVFILSESSKGYFVILDESNQKKRVMKNTIFQLIDQKYM